eukprot:1289868-Lingulodinium_polyedra.AAC.1
MAKPWPIPGQRMANAWPIHGQFMSNAQAIREHATSAVRLPNEHRTLDKPNGQQPAELNEIKPALNNSVL